MYNPQVILMYSVVHISGEHLISIQNLTEIDV